MVLACMIGLAACSNDEPQNSQQTPSLRDRIYSGKNLTVFIDGNLTTSVASANVKSQLRPGGKVEEDENGNIVSNPEYDTRILLIGFPEKNDITVLSTVMRNYRDFEGEVTSRNITYSYIGEFTGSPLEHGDNQGCIIRFTRK